MRRQNMRRHNNNVETPLTAHVRVIIVQCKLIICRVINPDFRFLLRKKV